MLISTKDTLKLNFYTYLINPENEASDVFWELNENQIQDESWKKTKDRKRIYFNRVVLKNESFEWRFFQWQYYTKALLQTPNLFAFWITANPRPEINNLKKLLQNYKIITKKFYSPGLFTNYTIQQKIFLKNFYLAKKHNKYIHDEEFTQIRPNTKILFNSAESVQEHLQELDYFITPVIGTSYINLKRSGEYPFPLYLDYIENIDLLNYIFEKIALNLQTKTWIYNQNTPRILFNRFQKLWNILLCATIPIPKDIIERIKKSKKIKNKKIGKFSLKWFFNKSKILKLKLKKKKRFFFFKKKYEILTVKFKKPKNKILKKLLFWKTKKIYLKILKKTDPKKFSKPLSLLRKIQITIFAHLIQKDKKLFLKEFKKKKHKILSKIFFFLKEIKKKIEINNYFVFWSWKKQKKIMKKNWKKDKKKKFKFYLKNLYNLKFLENKFLENQPGFWIGREHVLKKWLKLTIYRRGQNWRKIFNVFLLHKKKRKQLLSFFVMWRLNKNWIKKKEKLIKIIGMRTKKKDKRSYRKQKIKSLTPMAFFLIKRKKIVHNI